ncbi:MAG: hypothetical protein KGI67_12515 [Pseudomonadota bacterium]|nr:hypothetical protein [Pseudomonadota bacterium]
MKKLPSGQVAGSSWALALCAGVALTSVSAPAPAMAEGAARPAYQARCDLPHAGWNEEVVRAREAAERECKVNMVLRESDRSATLSTAAQEQFRKLRAQHDALLRSVR